MDMLPQLILTHQHTPMLHSFRLRMYSRHMVTAAESASGLDTVTTVATTAVMVVTMVEITAVTTVAMVVITVVMAATTEVTVAITADTVAIIESMALRLFIPAG